MGTKFTRDIFCDADAIDSSKTMRQMGVFFCMFCRMKNGVFTSGEFHKLKALNLLSKDLIEMLGPLLYLFKLQNFIVLEEL